MLGILYLRVPIRLPGVRIRLEFREQSNKDADDSSRCDLSLLPDPKRSYWEELTTSLNPCVCIACAFQLSSAGNPYRAGSSRCRSWVRAPEGAPDLLAFLWRRLGWFAPDELILNAPGSHSQIIDDREHVLPLQLGHAVDLAKGAHTLHD